MNLAIVSILLLLGASAWMLQEEKSTQLEINDLISLIDRLEQEKNLIGHFQKQQKKPSLSRVTQDLSRPKSRRILRPNPQR